MVKSEKQKSRPFPGGFFSTEQSVYLFLAGAAAGAPGALAFCLAKVDMASWAPAKPLSEKRSAKDLPLSATMFIDACGPDLAIASIISCGSTPST